jgi:hypothetical protein
MQYDISVQHSSRAYYYNSLYYRDSRHVRVILHETYIFGTSSTVQFCKRLFAGNLWGQ